MKKQLLVFILALGISFQSKAQTYVLIPDANFATELQQLIPTAMSGNSLNITSTLVTTSTQTINVSSLSIANLSGIQYFTSLDKLDCSNNSLTSLPTLPSSLSVLACYNNSLTSLPTLPSSLTILDCYTNSITSLPSLPNSLTSLYCYENSLTTLPALPSVLTKLLCYSNQIKCFPLFPSSLINVFISPNPYNCLPNYVLPAMNAFSTTPLCQTGNSNGCPVTSIRELNSNSEFISVYPNPSQGSLSIKIDDEISNGELVILNSLSQVVYTCEIKRGENKISSGIVSNGLYQFVILQNKQQFSRGKLIIE
jgi:hypothetical protein